MTRTPIKTNANSTTAQAARISSLVRQIKKAARKSSLGKICTQIDCKSHRLHEGRGCFKPDTLTKIVEVLKDKFIWTPIRLRQNGPATLVSIMGPTCGKLVI